MPILLLLAPGAFVHSDFRLHKRGNETGPKGARTSRAAHEAVHRRDKRNHMKTTDFDKYLDAQLKNPAFRNAYEDLEEEHELAKQIIRFRIDRDLSQAQLAKLVGTSQPAIARLES